MPRQSKPRLDSLLRKARLLLSAARRIPRPVRDGLLDLIETGTAGSNRAALQLFFAQRRDVTTVRLLYEHLRRDSGLQCALYSMAKHREPLGRAARAWGVSEAAVGETRELAEMLGGRLGERAAQVAAWTAWAARCEAARETVQVLLTRRAFEELLFSALETYLVPKGRTRFTEVYGVCLGYTRTVEGRRGCKVNVVIERCVPQLRAEGTSSSVLPSAATERIHLGLLAALLPHLEIVGDFHSHPWARLKTLRGCWGWRYSRRDVEHTRSWLPEVNDAGHQPRVALICALARHGRGRGLAAANCFGRNTFQRRVLGCQVVVAAYRIRGDGSYDDEITLALDSDL